MIILRSCALLAAFAVTAIAVLPLRLAWAGAGASADLHVDSISGSIWSGELSGVEWRGVALGDLVITSSALDRPGDLVLKAGSETGPLASASVPLSSRGQVVDDISASVRCRSARKRTLSSRRTASTSELKVSASSCRRR